MEKLQALVDHLTAAGIARPEQITGVMESGEPHGGFDQSGAALLVFRHRYIGRVVLEQLPHDLTHALAVTFAWLEENGDQRTDSFLGWVGEPSDDKLGDIDLRVEFEELKHYVVKPAGYTGRDVVTWRGVEYVPGSLAADEATGAEVGGETGC